MIDKDELAAELTNDEALKLYVYDDATGLPIRPGTLVKGHPSIGIGRCLDMKGLTRAESIFLNGDDIDEVEKQLNAGLPWFAALDSVRQTALGNMTFNLGFHGLLGFHDALALIASKQYEAAADAMLASHWATQTGARAKRIAEMIRTGLKPVR